MGSFADSMKIYQAQLQRGHIQEAYQGLMAYFRDLRAHFKQAYQEVSVSSSIYYGYMDMTYFALVPPSLQRRKLKIAIVFVHELFRFEVWLSGANRDVQTKTWRWLKESGWQKYSLASNPSAVDYVIDHVLVEAPDFRDLDALTEQIESGTLAFIREVESFFAVERGYNQSSEQS
ncbi:MAG TPA: hypothetical protein G4O08_06270 [Anaerolineae bacterium]|nr:hypothetical protein [Anaerolineae bacterium]